MTGDIGVFAQAVSNLLYLQNAIDSIYKDFMTASNPALPFQDLLIVFIGNYSSSDRYSEFWEIDNILASYFLPCWQILSEKNVIVSSTPLKHEKTFTCCQAACCCLGLWFPDSGQCSNLCCP